MRTNEIQTKKISKIDTTPRPSKAPKKMPEVIESAVGDTGTWMAEKDARRSWKIENTLVQVTVNAKDKVNT